MTKHDCSFKGSDGDFHYIDWGGPGPLAHFSHATGLCAGVYAPLVERLRCRLEMVGMDDRGHGKTKAPADPCKLKNWDIFVEDLQKFFGHFKKPVIAIGHSRGATVSMLLAIKQPELIRALVLIDPTILPYSWMWWWYLAKKTGLAKRMPIVATAARRKNMWPNRETILNAYRHKGVFQSWKDGFLEAYIAEGTEDADQGGVKLSCEPAWESKCFAVCPHDVWRYIPKLQHPTLILYGAKSDTFLPAAVKRFESNVPHATFRCFENTGHFVPMERPDQSAESILTFLKNIAIL